MSDAAVTITLTAGGITFVNQWYQTKKLDWKVPVATAILAAGIGVVNTLDQKAAIMLSVMILLGAASTKFNGKSAFDVITALNASKNMTSSKASPSTAKNQA